VSGQLQERRAEGKVFQMTRRSAIADCTARRTRSVERESFLLVVGAFRPKFYGNGDHVDNLIPFDS